MSFLKPFIDGCFVSTARLMREREFYCPSEKNTCAQGAFAHWSQRVSVSSALVSARELAGLSDAELAELEAEFVRCPMRQQPRGVRHAVLIGVALLAVAGFLLTLQASASVVDWASRILHTGGVICLLAGLVPLGVGLVSAFATLQLDLSHGTTGLYVGTLDEQHPWLYRAASLSKHEVAEDYRRRTLVERGPLRGVDYLMMRELVEAHDALDRLQPARSLAKQLQGLPLAVESPVHEPRLIRVGAASGRVSDSFDRDVSRLAAN